MRTIACLTALLVVCVSCSTEEMSEDSTSASAAHFDLDDSDIFERSCDSQVFGPDVSAGTRDRIGPLTLSGIGEAQSIPAKDFEPNAHGGLLPLKFVTQLTGTEPVWLVVASGDRNAASLIYDRGKWRPATGDTEWRFPLESGSPAVRFEPCHDTDGYTQYNGGMLASGARCITLELYVGTRDAVPESREVGFGRRC